MKGVVIACGGTGGHLTPGIALAQSLEERGYQCWLLISKKTVDSRLSQKYPTLNFVPMPGAALIRTPLGILRFLNEFWLSFIRGLKFIRTHEIDALVAFGGFTSLGPAMAARWQGIPIFLHEANRAVGKAVRLIARYSKRLYLPEGMRLEGIPNDTARSIGYPLRQDFRRVPRERARKVLGFSNSARVLVVLGGSQGASSLNQWVKENLESLSSEGISTYCITGLNKESSGTIELTGEDGETVTSRFVSFTDDMNAVLSAADLVISRAGAGAMAEIVCCRIPSILVPYPHAADNHQLLNANYLEAKGGAVVCQQDLMESKMLEEVKEMMFNEELRAIIRRNLFALDSGDVASKIVDDIRLVVGSEQGRETKRMRFWKVFA
jgi:UDP-N-acetylglucosamine--N-acetylmuramyl-(pentapeptide) pyrophosphoryl-undecaprenol N-acetylglucosamine transferase